MKWNINKERGKLYITNDFDGTSIAVAEILPGPTQQKDAQVIAVAPQLLHACKQVLKVFECMADNPGEIQMYTHIKYLIEEAEGIHHDT